jgi:hypothetical protein
MVLYDCFETIKQGDASRDPNHVTHSCLALNTLTILLLLASKVELPPVRGAGYEPTIARLS